MQVHLGANYQSLSDQKSQNAQGADGDIAEVVQSVSAFVAL
jgi:hypothetical protein